jgi:Gas vesicle synthesis protein GvpL/GvpF
MPPPTQNSPEAQKPVEGVYVYGIVERDVQVVPDTHGVGDPPAPIELVPSGELAALVSPIELDRPLGTTEDLYAHEEILDATAMDVPVLPMRFGAVVASRDAVVSELLDPYRDEFADALRELTDEIQYVVRARYVEEALMREVLAENPEAADLRDRLGGEVADATRDIQLRLGELVSNAVEAKRSADTEAVLDAVAPVTVATSVRPPTHEQDAAHVAMLVQRTKESQLERVLENLARRWEARASLRLLGPMAPYDFVVTTRT